MDCPEYGISCRLDEIVRLLGQGPSALEVWSFVIAALGTIASSAIAVVAIVLSVRASTASRRQDEAIRAAEARRRRADLAHEMAMWFADGKVFMLVDLPMTEQEARWSDRGQSLMYRARTFEHPGATALMQAAKKARTLVKQKPLERRIDAAIHVEGLFKLVTSRWVEAPESVKDINPEAWLDESWFTSADPEGTSARPDAPSQ